MTKIPAAQARLFKNVFVCRVCKSKRKVDVMKVLSGKVSCRKCGSKKLKAKRKK